MKGEITMRRTEETVLKEIPMSALKAMSKVIGYLYDDEKRHYEGGRQRNHIFLSIKRIDDWLESGK
jgi:hypothetical protein